MKAAKKLNYVPSYSARALKGQSAKAVGIFVDGVTGPVYGEIIEGVQEKLKEAGWGLIVGTLNGPIQELSRTLIRESWLAGSIILNGNMAPKELFVSLLEKSPLVVLDVDPRIMDSISSESRFVRIEIANAQGMELVFEEIKKAGRSRILFIEGTKDSWDSSVRKAAILALTKKHGFPKPEFLRGDFKANTAYSTVKKRLSRQKSFDCVMAANDEMAIGALRAFKEKGLSIPKDYIITGFDDIDSARWIDPLLSTVRVDRTTLGIHLADTLLSLIQSKEACIKSVTFPVSFIKREST
jgi:LacI family transcriptional regulator